MFKDMFFAFTFLGIWAAIFIYAFYSFTVKPQSMTNSLRVNGKRYVGVIKSYDDGNLRINGVPQLVLVCDIVYEGSHRKVKVLSNSFHERDYPLGCVVDIIYDGIDARLVKNSVRYPDDYDLQMLQPAPIEQSDGQPVSNIPQQVQPTQQTYQGQSVQTVPPIAEVKDAAPKAMPRKMEKPTSNFELVFVVMLLCVLGLFVVMSFICRDYMFLIATLAITYYIINSMKGSFYNAKDSTDYSRIYRVFNGKSYAWATVTGTKVVKKGDPYSLICSLTSGGIQYNFEVLTYSYDEGTFQIGSNIPIGVNDQNNLTVIYNLEEWIGWFGNVV